MILVVMNFKFDVTCTAKIQDHCNTFQGVEIVGMSIYIMTIGVLISLFVLKTICMDDTKDERCKYKSKVKS